MTEPKPRAAYYQEYKVKHPDYDREWRAKHPHYARDRVRQRRQEDPEWYEGCLQRARELALAKRRAVGIGPKKKLPPEEIKRRANARSRKRMAGFRREMLAHYGAICKCCGEEETTFLTIDHIDGKVPEMERFGKKLTGGTQLLRWMKQQGWPEGYQILCYNCNNAIRWGDPCPHATNSPDEAAKPLQTGENTVY